MKRKFWGFCVVMLLFTGIFAKPAAAAQFDTTVRESVAVLVSCLELKNGGEQMLGWGTCFFVGEKKKNVEYLVTNYHVIQDFQENGAGEAFRLTLNNGTTLSGKCKLRVYFDSSDYSEAYVIDFDEKKDIALLKLDSATDKRTPLPLCSPTDKMVGNTVYAVGYPGLAENIFADATTTWGMSDASVTSGTVSRLLTTSGTGVKHIQTDVVIQHGNSGGPLVNQKGSVIGINVASVTSQEAEKQYYAINIDELIPMLKLHDAAYALEGEGIGSMLIIIIALVAVILVAGVVTIIILATGKKKKASSMAPQSMPAPAVMPQQGIPQPNPMPQPNAVQKNPVVRSMAIQHNGAQFRLSGRPILIGRDASVCTVVFRQDTPGISGKHCSLSWDPASGDFLLTDLQSSYGTFLSNGQKLNPGVAFHLHTGDHFYLGENTNILCVELR